MTADFVMAEEAIETLRPEEDSLEFAVREHAQLIYRIAYSVLRNSADAEDSVQETFLRVLRHGNKLTRIRDQKSWLAKIAWRVAIERRNKLARSSRGEQATEDLPSPAEGADHVLLEKERGEILERWISALPDGLRDPLILSVLEELSPREVGVILGISEAAVRSRTFRARQILRDRLMTFIGDRK